MKKVFLLAFVLAFLSAGYSVAGSIPVFQHQPHHHPSGMTFINSNSLATNSSLMWHDRRLHAEDARIRSDFAAADASVRGESAAGDASIRRDFNANDAAIRNEVNQLRGDYDASVKAIQKENEKEFKKLRTEDRKIASVSTALASLELDPTRDGFSMGVALGVADFANGSDEIGEAVGLMYGKDDKAVNFKYGRSGSYSAAGVGITVGF